ncbi:MAG: dihydropteroate synthase [Prevotella sp.]|nr:dihydropteroate synthase [Prevotella sp.]
MKKLTINAGGSLIDLSSPCVMGILNATPDSFYAGSRMQTERDIAERANAIVAEGARIIDVGAFSTRPGAAPVSEQEEIQRLRTALAVVRREQPEALLSVDTFRPDVARMAVEEYGVGMVNDVSEGHSAGVFGGTEGPEASVGVPDMFRMVARLRVPYVLTSVRGTLEEMLRDFAREVQQLHALGQNDIILDPGFGFGKTLEQNYAIVRSLEKLRVMDLPLLVGLSRKSMIWKRLQTTAAEALNGTTVLNTIALLKGASILRVHDVRQAVEAVRLCCCLDENESSNQ